MSSPHIGAPSRSNTATPQRPEPTALQTPHHLEASTATVRPHASKKKRNNHRGGKKKRTRRQSFAASVDTDGMPRRATEGTPRGSFYIRGRNLSNTSMESEELLDHRDQTSMRPRRSSTMGQSLLAQTPGSRSQYNNPFSSTENVNNRPRTRSRSAGVLEVSEDESTPLLSHSAGRSKSGPIPGFDANRTQSRSRPGSVASSKGRRKNIFDRQSLFPAVNEDYNVNYPPSMPGSPRLAGLNRDMSFGDMLVRDEFEPTSPGHRRSSENAIDARSESSSTRRGTTFERRHTIGPGAEEDVCFPVDMSEIAEDDLPQRGHGSLRTGARRRKGKWPNLAVLDDWAIFDQINRNEERRAKKITEPQMVSGRLRPIHKGWHRAEEDAPYRFTYFNEEFDSTIHTSTLSELVRPEGNDGTRNSRELFIPDRPELSDSSDSEDEDEEVPEDHYNRHTAGHNGESRIPTRQSSILDHQRSESRQDDTNLKSSGVSSRDEPRIDEEITPPNGLRSVPDTPRKTQKPKRYGERPTWWLDVVSPTDDEMKVLSKTFGIHPLTAEDIMMQEAREKVELFRNYYFVNYRSFEQDMSNENFLEPVNMYVVVFREGVISFHFSMTPHPANVRRRVRQLKDYMLLSSDWISYAIIDDITDVFAPLIQNIEDEVDDIDDAILKMHSSDPTDPVHYDEKHLDTEDGEKGRDMLRRVGDCRKKVMGLYRLLGNKADVIKGFAKRCNEHWDVAPRSEIGLYLGDIQDHIVTMTGNLSHYEKILARSHANYLAQINIRMNERQEQTADVLGRLTVLGTIVLPMNIITGLWGMNVYVPWQGDEGNLTWFWCITAGLFVFGFACYTIARKLYQIV